jgi:phosphoserine phosphatase
MFVHSLSCSLVPADPNKRKYVATILSKERLSTTVLRNWFAFLTEFNVSVYAVRRLSESSPQVFDVSLLVPVDTQMEQFRKKAYELSSSQQVDIAIQADNVYRQHKRLIVLDMDSTLIQQEVIDELARLVGVEGEVGVRSQFSLLCFAYVPYYLENYASRHERRD